MLAYSPLQQIAPSGPPGDYDRAHLALYAALLEAEAIGTGWREVASEVMGLDCDKQNVEQCWRSHLERARWITGVGLGQAIDAFSELLNSPDGSATV
jgi:hypothetical protein